MRTFKVTHFYGSLYLVDADGEQHGNSHVPTYELGILQARAMNRCHGIPEDSKLFQWKAGEWCNAFFTEQAVIDRALATWREVFPKATKLVRGTMLLGGHYDHVADLDAR